MRRSALAFLSLLVWIAAPSVATAQAPSKVLHLGFLNFFLSCDQAMKSAVPTFQAFFKAVGSLGYAEGRNLMIECRSGERDVDKLNVAAADLARVSDVVFIAVCGQPMLAMRQATRTVPIVVGACTEDMVESGLATSLAHPGGNVTGSQKLVPGLTAKQLEVLKLVVPSTSRVAVFWNPAYSTYAPDWPNLRPAAERLGITLVPIEWRGRQDSDQAYARVAAERIDALLHTPDPQTYNEASHLAKMAALHHVPAIYPYHEDVEAGGLVSYGADLIPMFQRAAAYVDRIFKGEQAGDLPIEQPAKYELFVNLTAAKALGIKVPESILVRADKVIE